MAIGKPTELAAHMAGLVDSEGTDEEKGEALAKECNPDTLDHFATILEQAINYEPPSTDTTGNNGGSESDTPESLEG